MTTRAEWAKRVERWRDSGLTAKEFAAETGLKASSLSYWKWKLSTDASIAVQDAAPRRRRRSVPPASDTSSSAPTFVEVETACASSAAPLELALAHGLTLRIPVGFDENTLRRALSVFGALR
jgi:transposase